jgi:uncharacterized membrane protein YcgQ (UPF0703/DUF1980 family)
MIGCSGIQPVELSSGTTVYLESVTSQYFPGDKEWALVVQSVSDIPLSDTQALAQQTDELFRCRIQQVAEQTNMSTYSSSKNVPRQQKYSTVVMLVYDKKKPRFGMFNRKRFGFAYKKIGDVWERR